MFNCSNARSERTSAFRNLFTNPLLWVAITVSLLLQVAVIHLPLLNEAFETTPFTIGQWALCAGMASFVLWAEELRKLVLRRRPTVADTPARDDPQGNGRRSPHGRPGGSAGG